MLGRQADNGASLTANRIPEQQNGSVKTLQPRHERGAAITICTVSLGLLVYFASIHIAWIVDKSQELRALREQCTIVTIEDFLDDRKQKQ